MGQVPTHSTAPIGIVGDGRVARHFQHYFSLLDIPVVSWSRRSATADPHDALSPCETVLLLIRDDAIPSFVDAWPGLQKKRLAHFSGSLNTSGVEAAHPLMTFGRDLYDLPTYVSIPFILVAGGTPFHQLLPGLPNPSFTIPSDERPYYHALCVMAGNFSMILWSKLFGELQRRYGIPGSAAHAYLKQTTANLLADPGQALTGPLSRGDATTIAANLKALEGDPFHDVYLAMVNAYAQSL